MKKKYVNTLSIFLIFFAIPALADAKAPRDFPVMTISIKAKDKKKNIHNKKIKIFTNEIDFKVIQPQSDKSFNYRLNETRKPPLSFLTEFNSNDMPTTSLYEFNFTNNKSDINSIVFQFLPFYNVKSQGDNNGQSSRQNTHSLFRINFY